MFSNEDMLWIAIKNEWQIFSKKTVRYWQTPYLKESFSSENIVKISHIEMY